MSSVIFFGFSFSVWLMISGMVIVLVYIIRMCCSFRVSSLFEGSCLLIGCMGFRGMGVFMLF